MEFNLLFVHATNPSATGMIVSAVFPMLDGQYPPQACVGKPVMDWHALIHS
jgi:hypothetical protein